MAKKMNDDNNNNINKCCIHGEDSANHKIMHIILARKRKEGDFDIDVKREGRKQI